MTGVTGSQLKVGGDLTNVQNTIVLANSGKETRETGKLQGETTEEEGHLLQKSGFEVHLLKAAAEERS